MQCKQVGNRIEIIPFINLFSISRATEFMRSLEDAKWHGFDSPARKIWSVLDTLETRKLLVASGFHVLNSFRDDAAIWVDLEKLTETLNSI